ncbi:unnamed protein product [Paramecium sonneborni]|nr:unnamed protein product [Paramecium sonneborni]
MYFWKSTFLIPLDQAFKIYCNKQKIRNSKHCFLEATFSLLVNAYEDSVSITNLGRVVLLYVALSIYIIRQINYEKEHPLSHQQYQRIIQLYKSLIRILLHKIELKQYQKNCRFQKDKEKVQFQRILQIYLKEEHESLMIQLDELKDIMNMSKYQNRGKDEMFEESISLQNYHFHNWFD